VVEEALPTVVFTIPHHHPTAMVMVMATVMVMEAVLTAETLMAQALTAVMATAATADN
jgi:hypothetical protein